METPRLRSAFPETPAPKASRGTTKNLPENRHRPPSSTMNRPQDTASVPKHLDHDTLRSGTSPLIPSSIVDPPSQRLYAAAAFGLLQAYKCWDLFRLYSEDDSVSELYFIMKWLLVDSVFLQMLPTLRIPWLTFDAHIVLIQIVFMAIINIILGLKYQMFITVLFTSLWKQIYNREISISGRPVKVSDVVSNSSHILGKHTVHFLPEGSARLNPSKDSYCLDERSPQTVLPIRINATTPQLIQLSRIVFETGTTETINITQKEIRRLMKTSPRKPELNIFDLQYEIKDIGIYRLSKVIDVSNLVVRIFRSEALVVQCPRAFIDTQDPASSDTNKCKGDLSNLNIKVRGLPPLRVKYSRKINSDEKEVTIQSISPEGYESPLTRSTTADRESYSRGKDDNFSWAQPHDITIPLNESLSTPGSWTYSIDEVRDASGNLVNFTKPNHENDHSGKSLLQRFNVHERPMIKFNGCDAQNPSMIASGHTKPLPIVLAEHCKNPPYSITYMFTPQGKLNAALEHSKDVETITKTINSRDHPVLIKTPGLYTLTGISSKYCVGEVFESSSCLFLTPPDPSLAIVTDKIFDKCAGSSIGLTIDLTLVGTPPFVVHYRVIKDGRKTSVEKLSVAGTRHQLRLTPSAAGLYSYEFFALDDHVYQNIQIDSKELRAEQRVIPLAGAALILKDPRTKCCIEETVNFQVSMQGSGPWKLNYELINAGKRIKFTDNNITSNIHTIVTPKLSNGGEYTLALVTIEDSHGCKVFLENEAKIDVRRQRPSASFASIDGSFKVDALEGNSVDIPVRLVGEKPFTLKIARHGYPEDVRELRLNEYNSNFKVKDHGRYEILEIKDGICPGSVIENAKAFEVNWIPRPRLEIAQSPAIRVEKGRYIRSDVCEGDEDAAAINFIGNSPFYATIEKTFISEKSNVRSTNPTDIKAGVNTASLRMDTSRPGLYRYRFHTLSDSNYDSQTRLTKEVCLEQTVHPRPTAKFKNPGKVYKYCLDAVSGDDVIPIVLGGVPPFSLTVRIKHFSTSKYETVPVPVVDTNTFNFRIPPHVLTLGGHLVSVAKVRDARGCTWKASSVEAAPSVKVVVADNPTITSLDNRPYYCVGERLTFSLAGVPPFLLEYEFEGKKEKVKSTATFQRFAERPGKFDIISLTDSASDCKVNLGLSKMIYPIPSVRVSGGGQIVEGIHEGEQTEISFHLHGSPPFTFTYIRSEISRKGAKARVLEMHTQTTEEDHFTILASQEGTYEVISIQDRYCGYSSQKAVDKSATQPPYS